MSKTETVFRIKAKDQTKATLNRMRKNFVKMGKDVERVGRTMSMTMTAPILLFGASSLKAAGNFEASMNRVRAISGVSGKALEDMTQQAKDLGRTTQFSASEAADAMGFLSMAGFEANQVMGAMPSTLQLAAAAQMDLAQAADISSNVLTGFGLSVTDLAHANDVMIKTTNSANTDLSQLGEAMAQVAPIAAAMGISLEETSAIIGMLGNAGIQGSAAGSSLKGMLASLANPSAEASKRMAELGVNAYDAQGKMRPLTEIIDSLGKAGMDGGDALKIFGKIAGPGMAALVNQGSDALVNLTSELENSAGTAEKAANIQMEGFNGAIKKLKSAFEGLQIAIGDSGLLEWFTKFIEKMSTFIGKMASVDKSTMKTAVAFSLIVAALGPMNILLGKSMILYGQMPGKIKNAKKAMNTLKVAIGGVNVATLGWVAVVAAVLGAMLVIWANWGDEIKSFLSNVWGGITTGWKKSMEFLSKITEAGLQYIGDAWGWLKDTIFKVMQPVLDWLVKAYSAVYGFIIEGVGKVIQKFGQLLSWVAKAPGAPQWIKDMAGDVDTFGLSVENFGKDLDLGQMAKSGVDKLKSGINGVTDYMEGIEWGDKWDGFQKGFGNQTELVKQQFADMLSSLGMEDIMSKLGLSDTEVAVNATGTNTNGEDGSSEETPALINLDAESSYLDGIIEKMHLAESTATGMIGTLNSGFSGLGNIIGNTFGQLITSMVESGKQTIMLGRMFKSFTIGLISDLVAIIAKAMIANFLLSALGLGASTGFIANGLRGMGGLAGLDGKKAEGGHTGLGKTFLVGEKGPELFTPTNSGTITPNNQLSGNVTNNNSITIQSDGNIFSDPLALRRVAEEINEELDKVQNTYYATS